MELDVADPSDPSGRREQTWRFPARSECLVCHSRAAGFTLGFSPLQLDRDHDYAGVRDNQLRSLEHIGVFEGKLPKRGDDKAHPHLVNPYDTQAPLEARVRSYLHVNCSTCHVLEGGGNSSMELDLGSSLAKMRVIDVAPTHDRFGIEDARLVAPGSPERSVLLTRISRRGTGQMPPLVSTEVDRAAVEMITAWIRGLPAPVVNELSAPALSWKTDPACEDEAKPGSVPGMVQEGGLANLSEIDARTCDLRLEAQNQVDASLSANPCRSACHSALNAGIVNNQRNSMWHFRCTHTHSVLGWPGRARVMSDLMMLQRVAERAVPPASRAEGPKKWRQSGTFWGCISSICTPV